MQKKKNIKLLIILIVLLSITASLYFSYDRGTTAVKIQRDLLSYADPTAIDRVELKDEKESNRLKFNGSYWTVNDKYEADQQRVKVLFAILKQMRIRREVAVAVRDSIENLIKEEGVDVSFFEGNQEVHNFRIYGSELNGISYVSSSVLEAPVIVEIPGYRSFLAGIFMLDGHGWRDPLVFKLNWSNLQKINIHYPYDEESFSIVFRKGQLTIPDLEGDLDSLGITDMVDNISLLYVNDYLYEHELEEVGTPLDSPQAIIEVIDIADKKYYLEVFDKAPGKKDIIGRVDSADFAFLEYEQVRKVLKPKKFFSKKQ